MTAKIARHQPISPIFSELRPLMIAKKGTFEVRAANRFQASPKASLRFRSIEKENHRGEIAVKCQMTKGPKTDAPQKRMAGNTLDTLGRFALSQENATSNGGWIRRCERERNKEKGRQHHDQCDWSKHLQLSPKRNVFSLAVGPT